MLGWGIFIFLIALGLIVGGWNERKHLRSLQQREEQAHDVLSTQLKSFPAATDGSAPMMLVAEVVISSDYLKSFLAGIRGIFGGEVRSFQSLIDRARREAVLRLQEDAKKNGFNALCNIRLETANIGGIQAGRQRAVMMAAILASATAYNAAR